MAIEWKWANDPNINDVERMKLEKDGLDVIQDIYRYAETGFATIDKEDMLRFKWAGIYQQRPKTEPYFMMRVRIPGGILSSHQARVLADIAKVYGRDLVDITTRQAVQFHWLQIEDMPDIFKRLEDAGMSSFEACGDCPRTIAGNPLAGIDRHELIDTTAITMEMDRRFLMDKEFSNLPRKYKISVSGSQYNSANAEIQCLSFTPATKKIGRKKHVGFHVWVGGGLSSKPFLAQQLDIFVLPEQVVDMAVAITRIYRDYGFRQKRHMTRLKFLVADWGVERFKEKLIEVYGSALPSRGEDGTLGWNAGYYYGVQKQKQRGLNFIGLNVPIGRLSGEELHDLARISDEYGDGTLRTSVAQNIIIANIPTKKLNRLQKEATIKRITPQPKAFVGYAVSCTGNEYCNLALVETKERMRLLAEHMDHVISDLDTPVRMHMVGCPNSCGQRQVADIGFQGALVKTPQGMRDAFEIYLGGTLGPGAQYNEKLNGRVKADDLGPVVEQLVNYFKAERTDGETFHSFYKRVGATPFQERLDQAIAQLNN